jgi:PAS domain S-box-containing protein
VPEPAQIPSEPATSSSDIQVEELAAILETTAEGVIMFDSLGRISGCNRSVEALFGRPAAEIAEKNLVDLFAPESQHALLDYLESIKTGNVQSVLDHGRDVLGRTPDGGTIPLSVTIGRTRPDGARYFAVFRDKTPAAAPIEPDTSRRAAERTANAKADMLARLSHEIRMPVNAIIGFAEVMIDERFGSLGNERYVDYMKDIRASGERVISIIDDMLDLSRIESGKLDLSFSNQDLNALVEQCVAVMQPQANRERIIIRSSLTHGLPSVRADARALRQIALNLIGCSIHLANAGGQVIVSTAVTDLGDVALRIRDTGHGLNDNEIAAAMAPFRTPSPDEIAQESGANLSLTKALVEANRGRFHIKSAPNTGTLIEVVFDQAATKVG